MNVPEVSIIIPAYNAAKFIARAIESVLRQTYPNVETVVVNDGSNDDTEQVCRSYGDRIRYVYQCNRGVGAARNKGIEEAAGEILGFLDADDEITPNMVSDLMQGFTEYPQAGAVSGSYILLEDSGETFRLPPAGMMFPTGQILGLVENFFGLLSRERFICIGAVLLKRTVLEQVGVFQESLNHGEDIEMWSRIAGKFPWVYVDKVVHYYYCLSVNSVSRTRKVDLDNEFRRSVFSEGVMRQCIDPEKWDDYRQFRRSLFLAGVKYHIDHVTHREINALLKHVEPVPPSLKMSIGKAFALCPDGCLRLVGRMIKTYRQAKRFLSHRQSV